MTMTNRVCAMDLVHVVFLLVIDHENVIGLFGRKNREVIVSLLRISDSGTQPRRKYRHFAHCIYNIFFLLDVFIYYSLDYIYIFHSKDIYLFDISTRHIIYLFIIPC